MGHYVLIENLTLLFYFKIEYKLYSQNIADADWDKYLVKFPLFPAALPP